MEGEGNELDVGETGREPTPAAEQLEENGADIESTVALRDFSEWHGKT